MHLMVTVLDCADISVIISIIIESSVAECWFRDTIEIHFFFFHERDLLFKVSYILDVFLIILFFFLVFLFLFLFFFQLITFIYLFFIFLFFLILFYF